MEKSRKASNNIYNSLRKRGSVALISKQQDFTMTQADGEVRTA